MNISLITVPLVMCVIYGSLFYISSSISSKSKSIVVQDIAEKEFRASRVLNIVMYLCLSVPIVFFYIAYTGIPFGYIFPGIIGAIFLICNILGICLLRRVKVIFRENEVVYHDGYKEKIISFQEIKNVWVVNGFICIDTGKIPRFTIFLMFQDNHKIVALLESIALKKLYQNQEGNDTI